MGICNQGSVGIPVSPAAEIPNNRYNNGPMQHSVEAPAAINAASNVTKLPLMLFGADVVIAKCCRIVEV